MHASAEHVSLCAYADPAPAIYTSVYPRGEYIELFMKIQSKGLHFLQGDASIWNSAQAIAPWSATYACEQKYLYRLLSLKMRSRYYEPML